MQLSLSETSLVLARLAHSSSCRRWRSSASGSSTSSEIDADIQMRKTRLTAMRADVAKGRRPPGSCRSSRRRSPSSRAGSRTCGRSCRSRRTSPTPCGASRRSPRSPTWRSSASARQGRAAEAVRRDSVQSSRRRARITTSASFFDQISKFPRIINVSEISIRAKTAARTEPHHRRRAAWPRRSCCRKVRLPAREGRCRSSRR